jgi:hypothetical protein
MKDTDFSLPTPLLEKAIEHAKEHFGVFLYKELLIELYKEHLVLRGTMGFETALVSLLDTRYTQRTSQEQNLYKAVKSSFGVIASGLKTKGKKPKPSQKRTALDRLKDRVISDPINPQLRFIV